jgi:VWFA-related protein
MKESSVARYIFLLLCLLVPLDFSLAQPSETRKKPETKVRTVTIPITIFSRQELRDNQKEEFIEAGNIILKEDNDEQVILSIKSVSNTPMALSILIQENLSSSFNLELKQLGEFIKRLPKGSRVMVAYLRGGSIQVRQKFTEDLEKVSNSLRIVASSSAAPTSPYEGVREALDRFDALPTGRRAILLVSDGLDISSPVPTQSNELERAILAAQRKSVAVYSFYTSTSLTENGGGNLSLLGQGALNRLSEETGGRAFFQGTYSPVSFAPFFKDLNVALDRQFALTYLSTHMKKGFYRIQVLSTNPDVKIEHPRGYFYR